MKTHTGLMFSNAMFKSMQEQGYVRVNTHPDNPELFILNYTEKAAYEGVWNEVTLNCRGLIVDAFDWIIARPFPKFFNYGQPDCPEVDLDTPAVVSDKMDGSLGILYRNPDTGKYAIATRGSFASDQAIHATEILQTKYADFKPLAGYTYLFEIIYPENRIVCDYSGLDDLVFLGAVHVETGKSIDALYAEAFNWPGPASEVFWYKTMREALVATPRKGAEGFVVHFLDSDFRVKIKQEDYIALHRIVTGLNARSVWEAILTDSIDELIEKIPDEFHSFIRGVEKDILDKVDKQYTIIYNDYSAILLDLPLSLVGSKKAYALRVKNSPYSWALFAMYDGKDVRKELIKRAKPKHDYSPIKEDAE